MFFADGSGVRSGFHARDDLGDARENPCWRTHTGERFHLNMLSAISAKGELQFMTSRKRLSAALFIEFLRRLITNYPKKDLSRRLTDCPHTRPSRLHRFVHQVKDSAIRLFFLPPYSSEINPDELVWNDVKNHGVARTLIRAPRDLHRCPVSFKVATAAKKSGRDSARSSRWKRRVMQPLSSLTYERGSNDKELGVAGICHRHVTPSPASLSALSDSSPSALSAPADAPPASRAGRNPQSSGPSECRKLQSWSCQTTVS